MGSVWNLVSPVQNPRGVVVYRELCYPLFGSTSVLLIAIPPKIRPFDLVLGSQLLQSRNQTDPDYLQSTWKTSEHLK